MVSEVHMVRTSDFNNKPLFTVFDTCDVSLSSSPDSIATCWYILLSGSVFVKEHMYLARCWYVSFTQMKREKQHYGVRRGGVRY